MRLTTCMVLPQPFAIFNPPYRTALCLRAICTHRLAFAEMASLLQLEVVRPHGDFTSTYISSYKQIVITAPSLEVQEHKLPGCKGTVTADLQPATAAQLHLRLAIYGGFGTRPRSSCAGVHGRTKAGSKRHVFFAVSPAHRHE